MKRLMILAAILMVVWSASAGWTQGRFVRLNGIVQWIAGDRMMLILDGGQSVPIELTQVRQDQYSALVQRDRVTVEGIVSADNRRVFASNVFRDPYYQSP